MFWGNKAAIIPRDTLTVNGLGFVLRKKKIKNGCIQAPKARTYRRL